MGPLREVCPALAGWTGCVRTVRMGSFLVGGGRARGSASEPGFWS
jgi:hypothetical protein